MIHRAHLMIIFGCVFFTMIITSACSATYTKEQTCIGNEVLVNKQDFRIKATSSVVISPLPDSTVFSSGRGMYFDGGIANHDIEPRANEERAAERFNYEVTDGFQRDTIWAQSTQITFTSPTAEQYLVQCGVRKNIEMCILIAQYGRYFVRFQTHMSPTSVTYDELNHVLESIDKKMQSCLDKKQSLGK